MNINFNLKAFAYTTTHPASEPSSQLASPVFHVFQRRGIHQHYRSQLAQLRPRGLCTRQPLSRSSSGQCIRITVTSGAAFFNCYTRRKWENLLL
ncbi:hypothetical protein E2C01_012942 [Portunus trituberculatus]|uniref:Uncharacterized protein n=1 Tax=Portunus trituberculatus TaxID=210409 RepID=A0A5B7DEX9_PORTR|nr:hypothetical protein [Portunus trituberculatus]